MEPDNIINRLSGYTEQLAKLEGQFQHSQEGYFLPEGGDMHLARIVRELRDLYIDALGENDYSSDIERIYRRGRANFLDSPSLQSVQEIRSLVLASVTRFQKNPQILVSGRALGQENSGTSEGQMAKDKLGPNTTLGVPEYVTLRWLYEHVPYRFWLTLGGLTVSAFMAGVAVLKMPFVQALIGISCQNGS